MHVLLTNDDGPLDDKSCPYMKYFVDELLRSTDWKISIVVPDQQRSWIGKAHFAGKSLTTSYIYTKDSTEVPNKDVNKYEGPFAASNEQLLKDGFQEWRLIDSTPAACADIGLHHSSVPEPVDLVISGPNFGKNSGSLYILASGTVGAAMEAVTHGTKAIALSYEFRSLEHDFSTIKEASRISVALAKHLYGELQTRQNVDLFSVNVPLIPSLRLGKTKIEYAPIYESTWASIYENLGNGKFAWAPDFKRVWKDSLLDQSHSDNRVLHNEGVSVTPLQAVFKAVNPLNGEIILNDPEKDQKMHQKNVLLITIPRESYIYEPLIKAFQHLEIEVSNNSQILQHISKDPKLKVFHYGDYEELDIDLIVARPNQYFVPSYIYRKALIRKHYLANTIHHFVTKNPQSVLVKAFPATYQLEVDYAEFLDDSLDDAYELRDEIEKGGKSWILKPSMSDKGQGIRVFNNLEQLQTIFESFEEEEDFDEDSPQSEAKNGVIISQLRHFIVQEYQKFPLLLSQYHSRKFHLRTYVIATGDLKVYVYEQMLALFADSAFVNPAGCNDDIIDLAGHLTNTCIQEAPDPLVESFWELRGLDNDAKCQIFEQIKEITGDLFQAASSVDRINFQPLPNATEIFGVDFLVNEDLEVKLLEVNSYPDFKQTGQSLKNIIDDLFVSLVEHIIGPSVYGIASSCSNSQALHKVL